MTALFIVLGVLFLALFIIVPLVERYGKQYSPSELGKLTRWIFPLLMVLMVLQALRYFFF